MRLITHILFSIMVLLAIGTVFHVHPIVQIVVLAFVNIMIDFFGHSAYRGTRRTPMTHSPLSATVIGGTWGIALYFLLPLLGMVTPFWFMVAGGIMAAWTHLLLDSMTYNGIFVMRKRVAIAHFKNGLIDIPFLIVSFVLIMYFMGLIAGV
jgi:hypothetical protein